MTGPGGDPITRPRAGGLNFTALQFMLFAGVALVGLAALLATGLAFGLALAGAGCLAVLVLAVWFIAANIVGGERRPRPPASSPPASSPPA